MTRQNKIFLPACLPLRLCAWHALIFALVTLSSTSTAQLPRPATSLAGSTDNQLATIQDETAKIQEELKAVAKTLEGHEDLLLKMSEAKKKVEANVKQTKEERKAHFKQLKRTQEDLIASYRDPKIFGDFNRSLKSMEKAQEKQEIAREKCLIGLERSNKEYGRLRKRAKDLEGELAFRRLLDLPDSEDDTPVSALTKKLVEFETPVIAKNKSCQKTQKKLKKNEQTLLRKSHARVRCPHANTR